MVVSVASRRLPVEDGLEELEEIRLIRAVRESEDQAALRLLIESHRPLIMGCIKRLGISPDLMRNMRDDLINEGVLGLIAAIRNFDETKERRLSAIAKFHVRARMSDFALSNMSAIRPFSSRAQRTAFFHMRKLQSPGSAMGNNHMTGEETDRIADELGVDATDVSFIAGRLSGADVSLDGQVALGSGESAALSEVIADDAPHPEEALIERDEREICTKMMREAIDGLQDRDRDILRGRRLTDPPVPIDQLAQRYGISKGRVTQLEQQAMARLKVLISAKMVKRELPPRMKEIMGALPFR